MVARAVTAAELRARVADVIRAELVRLRGRRTGLTADQAAAVAETVRRVADGLLGPAIAHAASLDGFADDSGDAARVADLFQLPLTALEETCDA